MTITKIDLALWTPMGECDRTHRRSLCVNGNWYHKAGNVFVHLDGSFTQTERGEKAALVAKALGYTVFTFSHSTIHDEIPRS